MYIQKREVVLRREFTTNPSSCGLPPVIATMPDLATASGGIR
jgi:hypothetical protein